MQREEMNIKNPYEFVTQQMNFYKLAEQGKKYFDKSYEAGLCYNDMCVNATNSAEKYLKHLIMLGSSSTVRNMPDNVLQTHSIPVLLREAKKYGIEIPEYDRGKLTILSRYQYGTRYPEFDDSRYVTQHDIEICKRGLDTIEKFTKEYITYENTKTNPFIEATKEITGKSIYKISTKKALETGIPNSYDIDKAIAEREKVNQFLQNDSYRHKSVQENKYNHNSNLDSNSDMDSDSFGR